MLSPTPSVSCCWWRRQRPRSSQAKLIAEPWDVGRLDSYDVGRSRVMERREWARDAAQALRLTSSLDVVGTSDLHRARRCLRALVHDGFTLAGLVS